jgi:hypothetical protein
MPMLVIARYHCEVAGRATDSLDYQVKYFDADIAEEVIERLRAEAPCAYRNVDNEEVQWIFDNIVATELNPELVDGTELIGFVTGRPREND